VRVADEGAVASTDYHGLGAAGEARVLVGFDHARREDVIGLGDEGVDTDGHPVVAHPPDRPHLDRRLGVVVGREGGVLPQSIAEFRVGHRPMEAEADEDGHLDVG
jgi:hypothetical protein